MMLPFNVVLCIFIPFIITINPVAGRVDHVFMQQIREIISGHPSQCLSPLGKAWFFTMDGSCGKVSCKPPYTLCTVSYITRTSQDLHYQCTNVPARCLALMRQVRHSGNSNRQFDDAASTKSINGNGAAMASPENQQEAATCEEGASQGMQALASPTSSLGASLLGPIYILPISGCNNGHEKCCDWASKGECSKNPVMMKTLCKQACGTCGCRAEEVLVCQPAVNLISCKPPTKGPCRPKPIAMVTGAPEVMEPATEELEQPSEAVETEVPHVQVPEETAPPQVEPVTEAPAEVTEAPEMATEEYPTAEVQTEESQPPEVVTEGPAPETEGYAEEGAATEAPEVKETEEEAVAETEAPGKIATEGPEEGTTAFPEEVTEAPAEIETSAPAEVPTEAPAEGPSEIATMPPAEIPSGPPEAESETEAPAGTECPTEAPEEVSEQPAIAETEPAEPAGPVEVSGEIPPETEAPEPGEPAGPEVQAPEGAGPETTPQAPGTVAARPPPEVTYGPPAFPSSTCPDAVVTCAFWANKGECDKNPYWMKPNCQKSCNSCGATVGNVNKPQPKPGCDNQHELCQFWKSIGECATNLNYMLSKCPLSCDSCGKKPTFPEGPSPDMGYAG